MTDFDPLLARHTLPPPSLATAQSMPTTPARRPPARHRRRHAAKGARIAAAGLGVSTMFGLVASMGIANAFTAEATAVAPPATTPAALTPTGPATPASTAPTPAATTPPTVAETTAPSTSLAPVTLTARPEVRVITAPAAATPAPAPAPTPAATTSGSR
jgi:hypothetical protein